MELSDDVKSDLIALCGSLGIEDRQRILDYLERLWLPLASDLVSRKQVLDRTLIPGILGGQGTGKSTLCAILKFMLNHWGFSVATLSIDDLYLTYKARQALQTKNPRLIWRGPPGTHDVKLGLEIISQCLGNDPDINIALPRFDKSLEHGQGDRINPEIIPKPDILLFEGWFVGVQPINESCFDRPPAPIVTPEDRQFALDCNQRLQDYLPLWDKLDCLVVLYPEDYRLSQQWRQDAEHQMMATGRTGMRDDEIKSFVEYFWQALHPDLFIQPLINSADFVVEIKSDRGLGDISW